MRKRADETTTSMDQPEFTFSSDFRRPRGVSSTLRPPPQRTERRSSPPLSPQLPRTPRRRRGVAPASRRLAISPEAFGASDGAGAGYGGAVEVAIAILATMAFGLGWAAYELGFELPTSSSPSEQTSAITLGGEYALVVPTTPFGLAGAEGAEWTATNGDARGFTPTDDSSAR